MAIFAAQLAGPLLTASFARWCVDTVDALIDALKAGYGREARPPESA
jgi:hypothetical protein